MDNVLCDIPTASINSSLKLVGRQVKPEDALCDGDQSLNPEEFSRMMTELQKVAAAVGRYIHLPEPV